MNSRAGVMTKSQGERVEGVNLVTRGAAKQLHAKGQDPTQIKIISKDEEALRRKNQTPVTTPRKTIPAVGLPESIFDVPFPSQRHSEAIAGGTPLPGPPDVHEDRRPSISCSMLESKLAAALESQRAALNPVSEDPIPSHSGSLVMPSIDQDEILIPNLKGRLLPMADL